MQVNILALASFLAMVAAQAGVPTCATGCIKLPSQCQQQDIGCICGDSSFITDVSCCVFKSCSSADQTAALAAAETLCKAGGVTLTVTGATCSSTATSSSSSSASTVAGSTTTHSSSSSSSSSSGSSSATSTASSSGTTAVAVSGSSTSTSMNMGTTSTSASSSSAATGTTTSSTGVAPRITAMAGFFGAAAAAVALL